jgi:uncharacterized protein YlxW (UPF0749 family)
LNSQETLQTENLSFQNEVNTLREKIQQTEEKAEAVAVSTLLSLLL